MLILFETLYKNADHSASLGTLNSVCFANYQYCKRNEWLFFEIYNLSWLYLTYRINFLTKFTPERFIGNPEIFGSDLHLLKSNRAEVTAVPKAKKRFTIIFGQHADFSETTADDLLGTSCDVSSEFHPFMNAF